METQDTIASYNVLSSKSEQIFFSVSVPIRMASNPLIICDSAHSCHVCSMGKCGRAGSSRSKHLAEVEPRGAYFSEFPIPRALSSVKIFYLIYFSP
jgi:hypothetical protein